MKRPGLNLNISEDSRSDLGYGRLGNPRHSERMENTAFPYNDEVEDFSFSDQEEKLKYKIARKQTAPTQSDAIPVRDKSSFHSIIKISEIAKGLSPFPDMYKSRDGHISAGNPTISHHALGFKGTSTPSGHTFDREPIEDDAEEHIYTLEDLATKNLREYISLIVMDVL
jgi:hypothetical protein